MKGFQLLVKKRSKKLLEKLIFHKKYIAYWFFLSLIASFLVTRSAIAILQSSIEQKTVALDPLINFSPKPYPLFQTLLGTRTDVTNDASISAQAAIILDDDSQVAIYRKNPTLLFSMASTTKIMTAMTALQYFNPSDVLTIKTATVEGSVVGFKQNQQFHFEDILYGLLLPSGNDAALAIAENFPAGLDAFVEKMNENANAYHLINTHFADPMGLDDEQDYTTVVDLARLASIAMKNNALTEIVGTRKKMITDITGRQTYKLQNLNKLLEYQGVEGIKTGYTDEAGGVLTTSYVQNGHRFIIVVMKSEDRFADTLQLLQRISANVTYKSIGPK